MRCVQRPRRRDQGSVDTSIPMLFGSIAVLFVLLLVFEVVAYWHARNVYGDAAAEGARVAAAWDGSCAAGVVAARSVVAGSAGSWAGEVEVTCTDGPIVAVTVAGRTPGVLGGAGMRAGVTERAPKEQ